jgi:hypothetical protein
MMAQLDGGPHHLGPETPIDIRIETAPWSTHTAVAHGVTAKKIIIQDFWSLLDSLQGKSTSGVLQLRVPSGTLFSFPLDGFAETFDEWTRRRKADHPDQTSS